MPQVQNVTLGGGQQPLDTSVTHITSAQLQALKNTPVQLVSAPGAGKIVVVFGVAIVYGFGTVAYFCGGNDRLQFLYGPAGDLVTIYINDAITQPQSTFDYESGTGQGSPDFILPGDDNSPIIVTASNLYNQGPIKSSTLGAGGAGYAVNDTGTITTGTGDATYKILSIGALGAVATYQITFAGTQYAVLNGVPTATGGAQPGVGVGFTINITAVTVGDGTLKVVTYYQTIPVP